MKASIHDFITKIFTQIKNNFGNVDNTSDADKPVSKAQQAEFDAINNNLDKHTGNNTIHIIADERTKWDDANDKKHTHSNKSVIDKITQTLLDAWNDAYTHISDTVKHITSDERMSWNNKYSKPSGGIPKTDLASNVQTSLGKADTALQAHQDISGKANVSEAGYSLSVSGTTVSLKNKAGTVLSSITTQDTNTTYSTMTGATSSAAGSTGLVPAPASGKQASFLRGDGTWAVPTDTNTVTTVTTTGSGNAVTAITASNGALTVTKGTTFLTSHQDISGKMDKVDPTGTGSFSLNRKAGSTVGTKSFAEGNNTTASGNYSHAEGNRTIANGESQHVQGKFNVADTTSAFIIGNGEDDSTRSNAMKVDWDGNLEVAGDLKDGSGNTLLTAAKTSVEWLLVNKSYQIKMDGVQLPTSDTFTDWGLAIIAFGHTNDSSRDACYVCWFGGTTYTPRILATLKSNSYITLTPSSNNTFFVKVTGYNVGIHIISLSHCTVTEI